MRQKTTQLLISASHLLLAMSVPLLFLLTLPKHRSMSILFALFVLFDGYIYYWYKKNRTFLRLSSPVRDYLLPFVHSLSYVALVCFLSVHSFEHFAFWSPYWRTYGLGILFLLYMSKSVLFAFLLLQDLLRALWNKRKKSLPALLRPTKVLLTGAFAALIVGLLGVYASIFSVFSLQVNGDDMVDARLPEAFDGYRIAVISDLHIGSQTQTDFLLRVGKSLRALDPDLLVFTGDMVNFHSSEVLPFFEVLQSYRAKDGIYCIRGNHDYANYLLWDSPQDSIEDVARLENIYRALNWTLLKNSSKVLRRGEDSIVVAGVEMFYKKMKRSQKQLANTAQSLAGISPDAYTLLLAHNPQIFESDSVHAYPSIRVILSGHTHGGQIAFPLGEERRFSPAQFSFPYWAGHYSDKDKQLYVNTGTGFNAIPFRWFVLPELTLVTLRKN